MKSLADASFFRAFDALADAGNPGLKKNLWDFAGAQWRRDRYSLSGPEFTVVIEAFMIRHTSRPCWKLLVAKEHWWGEDREIVKSVRWARPIAGIRADVLAWFRKLEQEVLERGP
ncbi:MAG: hypothetical protein ACE5FO_02385 [Parvularculaceae bacterium]